MTNIRCTGVQLLLATKHFSGAHAFSKQRLFARHIFINKRHRSVEISPYLSPSQIHSSDGYSSMPALTPASKQSIETIHFPEYYETEMIHNHFMDLALQQARLARENGEVPIGAVVIGCFDDETIICDGYTPQSQINESHNQTNYQILSMAHNLIETNMDASSHAELLALRQGARNMQNWRYPPNSTLYTTLEPCPMCLSSIQAFRIDNIVYGAPDHRLGAIESHVNLLSVVKHPFHEIKSVLGGVRRDECSEILIDFFRVRRKIAKEKKEHACIESSSELINDIIND
jgi:tRNA(adenine34) deaminase